MRLDQSSPLTLSARPLVAVQWFSRPICNEYLSITAIHQV